MRPDIFVGVISAPALLLASGDYIRENCFRAQPTTSAIAGPEEANNRSGESFLRLIQDPLGCSLFVPNPCAFRISEHSFTLYGARRSVIEYWGWQSSLIENKDAKLHDGRTFSQVVLDDFKEFQGAGITHPDMEKIKALLTGKAQDTNSTNSH